MNIEDSDKLNLMRQGGRLLAGIRDQLLAQIKLGKTPLQIEKLAQKLIAETGGSPSFMTVKDYRWATCISVNDGVVHGIPTDEPFKSGDMVSIDVGLLYQGYHTDTSWTIQVKSQKSKVKSEIDKFLYTGREALNKAISQARAGNRVGHLSQAIQDTIEGAGYSVVRSLVGHGIGKKLHEPPQIPGRLFKPITQTELLKPGMTLAIEVIYNMGGPEIVHKNSDGWTLVTADGSISGLFEQTVEITDKQAIILTQS